MSSAPASPDRRAAVRRTVLWLVLAAVAVYGAFILGGVFGFTGTRGP
jgi:hypothetical protein